MCVSLSFLLNYWIGGNVYNLVIQVKGCARNHERGEENFSEFPTRSNSCSPFLPYVL